MPDAVEYEPQTLFLLEPTVQPSTPLPTRWWTGHGTLQMDVGDGSGTTTWQGGSFGNTQVLGVSAMEASAEGVPQRLSLSIGIDETRDDLRHSVTAQDLGPVAITIFFVYREADVDAWTLMSDGTEARVIKGRSAQATFENGVWSFEVENRVHDANRLIVDVWSDAAHRAKNTGDAFFEFASSIEAGLEFDWPN